MFLYVSEAVNLEPNKKDQHCSTDPSEILVKFKS